MGKIVITTNISLDGVIEDPDGQEGFTLGGWFGHPPGGISPGPPGPGPPGPGRSAACQPDPPWPR